MAYFVLMCMLRPLDLVPLIDFTYKYHVHTTAVATRHCIAIKKLI